ncbi:hypothetical protein [Nonomuraea salmonea]|uniref:hypothetical protein n=1 Tax=Nonomuraea salmonea TaxID=46181 RepID=UPI0031EA6F98
MVDRERGRHGAGGAAVGAGDGGHRRGHGQLARTAGLVGGVGHDDDPHVGRGVPLAGVEVVVPARLEEGAVAQVQA